MNTINDILGVILGGGVGKRLYPLTKDRAKPAVPMAGKYRLIDVPLSNCINSGIHRIAILTQFNSVSLHRHITQTYRFDYFHSGWVQIWAAEQTPTSNEWYQGTADAVRKQISEIISTEAKFILILAGDHLYRMDYEAMAEYHWATGADITVAVQPVSLGNTTRFGILRRTADGRITDFAEKPRDPEVLAKLVSRDDDPFRPYLGSMGIYIFNIETLISFLDDTPYTDFGGDVIPSAIHTHKVYGFDFDDYWEDIGTVRSFYDTNLSLTQPDSPFDLYNSNFPIYTHARFLPGSILNGSILHNVLLAEGCRIGRTKIQDCVIGLRSLIEGGSEISSSIVMGNDYYEDGNSDSKKVPLGIGANCLIEGAILDKNVRIGAEVTIKSFPRGTEIDMTDYVVRDGIVVIPKRTIIPDGTYIGPQLTSTQF